MRKQVLWVSANAASGDEASIALRSAGYTIRRARNRLAALKEIDRVVPDVIVLDLLMDLAGIDLCKDIRRYPDTRHIPILALSPSGWPGTQRVLTEAGVNSYLLKPVADADLVAAVDHLVESVGSGQ